jgi:hypothetical protein
VNATCPELRFRILDQGVRVRCADAGLRNLLLANFAAFEDSGADVTLDYSVSRRPGGFCISRNDERVVEESDDEAIGYLVVYTLEKLLTLDLQHLRTDLFFVHSAALERRGRVIMIAADSGTGKSTTSWALLQHGFRYLSDELAPIDPVRLDVHPYPHALCLKAAPPGPYPLPDSTLRTERTLHIPVAGLPTAPVMRPASLGALLFLRRDSRVTTPACAGISPAEAGARLYANTLTALAHPGNGLDAAIRIATAVPAFTVSAGDLQATCELISTLEDAL